VIRVDASTATILLTEAPAPKVRDRQTGEVAKVAVRGEAPMRGGVVFVDEGKASLIQVTISGSRGDHSCAPPRASGLGGAGRTTECPYGIGRLAGYWVE
jgi:hypothetical protein